MAAEEIGLDGLPGTAPATATEPTKVTVHLTPKSIDALHRAARASGLSRTDTINRAVQFYGYVLDLLDENRENALVLIRDGHAERINPR